MAKKVSITKTVRVPAEQIFDALTDPTQHALIDGSGSVRGTLAGTTMRLKLGDTFGMDMRLGAPYRVTNRVVEYEEGKLIAWRHFGGHRWRWELTPVDEQSTEVTETFDYSTAHVPFLVELAGFPARNRKGIQATLDRLEAVLGGK
ncbi:MAG TPA: SRPBCC family protein [Pseudonocardiaceae bacterium]